MRLRLAAGLLATVVAIPIATAAGTSSGGYGGPFDPSRLAGHIPAPMLAAYLDASRQWELDWALLAAIGQLECDHGRSRLPGCWPPGSINHAGARGPMQFLGSTWRTTAARHDPDVAGPPAPDGHGYATDGDGDGIADPWSTYDAVHAAARYLTDLDAHNDPRGAARRYNAGPNNPNPQAGEGYATRTIELASHYRTLAGVGGPGTPATTQAAGGDCSLPDPTGTGGCVTPATANLVHQLQQHFGDLPISCWAPRPANPTSDHPAGRACDITIGHIGRHPTPTQRDHGWTITNWLTANADPLEIAYLIWDGHIWSPTSSWRPYRSRTYNTTTPTGGHYDHIHASVQTLPVAPGPELPTTAGADYVGLRWSSASWL